MMPRVVFGLTTYNRPDKLSEVVECILSQTYYDLALVIVDDSPSGLGAPIAEKYARLDRRVHYERNPTRFGMVAAWRKCFELGRSLYPEGDYFAWASDHDIWHPRWTEELVAELDRHPDVVLTYSRTMRQYDDAHARIPPSFETFGLASSVERVRQAAHRMRSGDLIYGLFRARSLEQAGVFRKVLLPDREVLLQLAVLGQFKLVREVLWYREVRRNFSLERQRVALFGKRIPLHTYLPCHVTHFWSLAWNVGVCGRARPVVGRLQGLRCAGAQFYASLARDAASDGAKEGLRPAKRERAVSSPGTTETTPAP